MAEVIRLWKANRISLADAAGRLCALGVHPERCFAVLERI
jgi:hypothetical protein